jgi:hypothetical protein
MKKTQMAHCILDIVPEYPKEQHIAIIGSSIDVIFRGRSATRRGAAKKEAKETKYG